MPFREDEFIRVRGAPSGVQCVRLHGCLGDTPLCIALLPPRKVLPSPGAEQPATALGGRGDAAGDFKLGGSRVQALDASIVIAFMVAAGSEWA